MAADVAEGWDAVLDDDDRRTGWRLNIFKDAMNAGANGILRCYPDIGLDVVVLSNCSVGALDVIDEIHRLLQTAHPVVGESGF